MHKNIYRRYALVVILLCLWAPAKSLIASHREPHSEVNPDYNENFVVQTSLIVPDFSPSAVYYEQNNIAFAFRNRNETGNTEIYRSLNSDTGYELIATVPHTTSQYHDTNLKNHTTYYYKLRAVDGNDASALSEPGSFTSYAKNFSPTLTATALNDTTIELRLTDNSFNDYIYEISSVGSAEPAFYESFLSPTDSGSVVVFTHHPVSPGTTYTYQVNMTTYGEDMPTLNNVASATATTPDEAGDETNAEESSKLSLYPNPSLKREVTLSLHGDNTGTLNAADIEVVSVSGTVVYRESVDCAGGCSDILLLLNNNIPPGIYTVNINSHGKRLSKRLMLK